MRSQKQKKSVLTRTGQLIHRTVVTEPRDINIWRMFYAKRRVFLENEENYLEILKAMIVLEYVAKKLYERYDHANEGYRPEASFEEEILNQIQKGVEIKNILYDDISKGSKLQYFDLTSSDFGGTNKEFELISKGFEEDRNRVDDRTCSFEDWSAELIKKAYRLSVKYGYVITDLKPVNSDFDDDMKLLINLVEINKSEVLKGIVDDDGNWITEDKTTKEDLGEIIVFDYMDDFKTKPRYFGPNNSACSEMVNDSVSAASYDLFNIHNAIDDLIYSCQTITESSPEELKRIEQLSKKIIDSHNHSKNIKRVHDEEPSEGNIRINKKRFKPMQFERGRLVRLMAWDQKHIHGKNSTEGIREIKRLTNRDVDPREYRRMIKHADRELRNDVFEAIEK